MTHKGLKPFEIQFSGLVNGEHIYEFDIDDKFFECFEGSEITQANMKAEVALNKQDHMLQLHFYHEGTAVFGCDRCGDDVNIFLEDEQTLIFKFGDVSFENSTEEIIVIDPSEYKINIAQYLYEFIYLSVPSRRLHDSEEDCNKENIDILEAYRAKSNDDPDPRWGALNNLK